MQRIIAIARRLRTDEDGYAASAIIAPVIFLLLFTALQGALWYQGTNVAQNAAVAAYNDARAYESPPGPVKPQHGRCSTRPAVPPAQQRDGEPIRRHGHGRRHRPGRVDDPRRADAGSAPHDHRPGRAMGAGTMMRTIRRILLDERGDLEDLPP